MSEGSDGHGSDAGEFGGGAEHGGHGHGHGHGSSGGDADTGAGDGLYRLITDAPRGWLAFGIEPGFAYKSETFAHAQAYGYAYGVKKVVPKGTSLTAVMSEVVALEAAREIGGVTELAVYKTGFLWEHPAFRGITPPAEGQPQGRLLNLPGVARSNTTVEVLAWPHNACTPMDEVRRIMERLGLTRVDLRQSSQLAEIDKRDYTGILSNNPFGDPKNKANKPNGWFREATGETHIWREFYQVKGCGSTGWPWSRPSEDDLYGTFLCVFGVTYKYAGTNDYETRIAFAVYSSRYCERGQWTGKWNQIKQHREAAERAAKAIATYLARYPAPCAGVEERKRKRLEDLEPVVPAVVAPPRIDLTRILEAPPPSLPRRAIEPEGEDPEVSSRRG